MRNVKERWTPANVTVAGPASIALDVRDPSELVSLSVCLTHLCVIAACPDEELCGTVRGGPIVAVREAS